MKILWKRGEIAPKEQFLLFSTIFCCLLVDLCIKTGTRFSLRDKRLFEISEFEITRVDCNFVSQPLRFLIVCYLSLSYGWYLLDGWWFNILTQTFEWLLFFKKKTKKKKNKKKQNIITTTWLVNSLVAWPSWTVDRIITKTCLYNFDPLKPHFYIVKLGFTGVYIIVLISAQKHRLWILVRVPTIYVLSRNMKNIRIFYLKIFSFWRWNFLYIWIGVFS